MHSSAIPAQSGSWFNLMICRCFSDLEFVTVTLLFALTFGGLNTDFFVIFLQCGQILTCLAEFAFFHSFSDIPVNESTLGIHEVELVVNAGEHFCDGCRIANHADSAHNFSQVTTGHYCRWLVIDAAFEARRAPINELDCPLRL